MTARQDMTAWSVGVVLGAVHMAFAIQVSNSQSEGSWLWFPVFLIDFPFSVLPLVLLPKEVPPLVAFGVTGSIWWFAIGFFGVRVVRKYLDA